jgi:hypothetical protein
MFRIMALPFAALAFIATGLSLFASGCASGASSTMACPKLDWYEAGRRDGAEGRPSNQAEARARDCGLAPVPSDPDAYINGRNAGLTEYCTAAAGLEAGRLGQTYRGVCPGHLEPAFLAGYEAGQRIQVLEEEHLSISRRLDAIFRALRNPSLRPDLAPELRSMADDLKRKQAKVGELITSAEREATKSRRF